MTGSRKPARWQSRRIPLFLLCAVAGPAATCRHHPACRRSRAGRAGDVRRIAVDRAPPRRLSCIVAAALVPWRLHDVAASRDDVRGADPVEAAAVNAIVAGMPDPAVLLDRAGRVLHLNAAAVQLAPALRKNELAQFALRSPEIITALREAIATARAAPRHLSRPCSRRSLDGARSSRRCRCRRCSAAPTNAC